MIKISNKVSLQDNEIEWQFIRSSGPGGQNVNKVATAAQLIFNINASSLSPFYKQALLKKADHRLTKSGKIIIKCQQSRSQEANRQTALTQFIELIHSVTLVPKKRIATKPTIGSQRRRLDSKKLKGRTKALRNSKISY